jgi:carboxyl-terminal processing protease
MNANDETRTRAELPRRPHPGLGPLVLLAGLLTALPVAPAGAQGGGQGGGGDRLLEEARAMLLGEYYDDKLQRGSLDAAAVQGMMASLNGGKAEGPNVLLDARAMAELRGDLKGELVGIGAQIDYDEATGGVALVLGVLPGSTAALAGIEPGDRILSVDGKGVRGQPLRQVVAAIRGAEGSSVKVGLLRGAKVIEKTIARRKLAFPSVEHRAEGDTGLVTIRLFNERTPEELQQALAALWKADVKRLLIDLRGNPGGLFEKSIEAAELLVPRGAEIARSVGRSNNVKRYQSKRQPVLTRLPMVVLVDGQTGSSAEVLAEALRITTGATLVGQKTFGKWRMETLRPLSGGYTLKFTIAMVQSPAGQSFDGKGLQPDVEVPAGSQPLEHTRRLPDMDKRREADPQLKAGLHVLLRLRG